MFQKFHFQNISEIELHFWWTEKGLDLVSRPHGFVEFFNATFLLKYDINW